MFCAHPARREIAPVQNNVRHGRLLEERFWWCKDCDEKWTTSTKLGDVASITLSVDLKQET